MSTQRLATFFAKGNVKECMKFFRDMPENERAKYAKQARGALSAAHKSSWKEVQIVGEMKGVTFQATKQLPPASAAFLWTCSFGSLKKMVHHLWSGAGDDEMVYEILAARRPDWLRDWADWTLEERVAFDWLVVRRLVREGICPRPTTEQYIRRMVYGIGSWKTRSLYRGLMADPGLIQDEIWQLFEITAADFKELADYDSFLAKKPANSKDNKETWSGTLVRLCSERRLDRQRLLDVSLSALARDPHLLQASWFWRFHEALAPTLAERVERQPSYVSLLASRNPPTVSFAIEALLEIHGAGKLDALVVLAGIGPALWNARKGTVELALQLLERIGESHADLRDDVAVTSLEALQHEKPDIHKAALKLVEKFSPSPGPRLVGGLRARADAISLSQRPRLLALLNEAKATAPARLKQESGAEIDQLRRRAARVDKKWRILAGIDDIAIAEKENNVLRAVNFIPLEVPHLCPELALKPIRGLEELIDVFAQVLEDQNDPMKLERVFDGLARLCDQKPKDFSVRTGPLAQRAAAAQGGGPFCGCCVFHDLCGLVLAWTTGQVHQAQLVKRDLMGSEEVAYQFNPRSEWDITVVPRKPTVRTFLSWRLLRLARRVAAGQNGPHLSTPTHLGGWIDPRELVARSQQRSLNSEDLFDQILALLRLAPDHREDALLTAKNICGEWGDALRYALGGTDSAAIGPTVALWIAAARSRAPDADDPLVEARHPHLGPDAGLAAQYKVSFNTRKKSGKEFVAALIDVNPEPEQDTAAEFPTVLLAKPRRPANSSWESFARGDIETLRLSMTVWPAQRQSWFAVGSRDLSRNLDWQFVNRLNKTYLEPLLDPDVPLGEMGYLLLALGLAAKEPGEHGLATDALIAAIDDGRIDAERLGGILARLLPTGLVKAARYAKTLAQAARVSLLHAWTIARALERGLRHDPRQAPRDLSALLELLRELLAELGQPLVDPEARQFLEHLKGREDGQAGPGTAGLIR